MYVDPTAEATCGTMAAARNVSGGFCAVFLRSNSSAAPLSQPTAPYTVLGRVCRRTISFGLSRQRRSEFSVGGYRHPVRTFANGRTASRQAELRAHGTESRLTVI